MPRCCSCPRPTAHGYCTLGTSVDTALAAAVRRAIIIAEINERMPRTHGNTVVPFERITAFVHTDRPLVEQNPEPETDVEARIGELVAGLVEDGATLQMGIGAIPDAALLRMRGKRDLGIHTEMFSDGVVELFEAGAITNRLKSVHREPDRNELRERHPRSCSVSSTTTRSSSSIRATARTTRR